ncbi:hypothetical protein PLEOSDRAFT_1085945 [Pleurotus ostreatus PC15]|uniref:Adenylate kinase n=1 Tax=Pleurotus ostreatus (strain PC15) TaxID=1137138 RepID=A0A067NA76_PLEO1|nr:hypothetical protein PLEOSDRAFT_1085945 [Pleurotus ostreatus PC15]
MSQSEARPPLLADADGVYRVHIIGNSGSGKSTLGKELSSLLGLPHIPLDPLFWKPGWTRSTNEEFCQRIREALDSSPGGWIVDGNYTSMGAGFVTGEANNVIWMDPPLLLYFPRVMWRTFLRLLRLREPCSPGCAERPAEVFFSKESILWWCLTNHFRFKRKTQGWMADPSFARKTVHLAGWGSEYRRWWSSVVSMVKGHAKST